MSLIPDFSSLQSMLPSSLSFSLSELDVLVSALLHYSEMLKRKDVKPEEPVLYSLDGKSDLTVCDELISKFCNYSFK